MKIVFLDPVGQLGGAEWSLIEMIAALRACRPDWSLHAILGDDGPLSAKLVEAGATVSVLPFPDRLQRAGDFADDATARNASARIWQAAGLAAGGVAAALYIPRLANELRRLAPDVTHSNGHKMHIAGAWAAPRSSRLIWHMRDFVSDRPMMSRLLRAHGSKCSAAIANSQSVADDVRKTCGARPPVFVLHNAVDLDRFAPCGPALDLDQLAHVVPASDHSVVRIGMVATTARWKGHEVFLRALSMLPRELRVRGYVIGGPLYRTAGSQYQLSQLRAYADGLGLNGNVAFTGFVEDTAAAIRALDIVVHASTRPEPFGRTIAEGMACAKPVVVSSAGGAAEIVEDGVDACCFPQGKADDLANLLAALVNDESRRRRIGEAGRKSAEKRFGRAQLAERLLAIYSGVLASPAI
jgi:glycosyltransferase involved in cell wall biosynthesis